MDNVCYFVATKFRVCQSGVPLSQEKAYTNVSTTTNIQLYFGYILNVARATNDSIDLIFTNTALNLNFTFTIPNGGTAVFDLPIDSGTFRVAIFASARCCALN